MHARHQISVDLVAASIIIKASFILSWWLLAQARTACGKFRACLGNAPPCVTWASGTTASRKCPLRWACILRF